jgi:hypothetical protein
LLFHSEHSYGTTRDSDEEDAEPEDGERLDHPYSAPQVWSSMFCLKRNVFQSLIHNVLILSYLFGQNTAIVSPTVSTSSPRKRRRPVAAEHEAAPDCQVSTVVERSLRLKRSSRANIPPAAEPADSSLPVVTTDDSSRPERPLRAVKEERAEELMKEPGAEVQEGNSVAVVTVHACSQCNKGFPAAYR